MPLIQPVASSATGSAVVAPSLTPDSYTGAEAGAIGGGVVAPSLTPDSYTNW